jgi:hypothetical protein
MNKIDHVTLIVIFFTVKNRAFTILKYEKYKEKIKLP